MKTLHSGSDRHDVDAWLGHCYLPRSRPQEPAIASGSPRTNNRNGGGNAPPAGGAAARRRRVARWSREAA